MLEKANERNIKPYRKSSANLDNYSHLLEVDEKQRNLTEKWILPHIESILRDLGVVRARVDKTLERSRPALDRRRMKDKKPYPVGMCQQIRDAVYKDMLGSAGMNKDFHGLQMIRHFIREGGIVQPFWGIDQGKFFQNAIQLGTSILDVANDTVDPKKPKIVFHPDMKTAPIQKIISIEDLAEVMESYWAEDIYPNIYFPNLAPFFPMISVKKITDPETKKMIRFIELPRQPFDKFRTRNATELTPVNTPNGEMVFGEANVYSREFIFNSKFSKKRLPKDVESALHKKFATGNERSIHYYSTDIDKVSQVFNELNVLVQDGLFDTKAFSKNVRFSQKMGEFAKIVQAKIWVILPDDK